MNKLFSDLMDLQTPPPSSTPAQPQSPDPNAAPQPPAAATTPKMVQSKPRPKPQTPQESNIATPNATNIAILHFSKEEIDELRSTAYKNQTFRFSEDELNWLKDRSYGLSRALGRKVGQNDLLRISLRVFRKAIADKQEILEEILDPII